MPYAPYRTEQESSLTRAIMISTVVHLVVLVASSIIITTTTRLPPNEVMQVRLVGVPIPAAPAKKMVEKEPVRTQDSAAPKEPPPITKEMPPSEAKTQLLQDKPKPKEEKPEAIEAQKRPPVLDKNPEKKKVVKNDLKAKVVKNPEDYLNELDFLDDLKTENTITPKDPVDKTDEQAGEGEILQLNMSEQGEADKIKQHIERFWMKPPGADTRDLYTIVYVEIEETGTVLKISIRQSSGQPAFDSSIERAIRKASPLPLPAANRSKFQRLELHFQG